MNAITTSGLSKDFGSTRALVDLNLDVARASREVLVKFSGQAPYLGSIDGVFVTDSGPSFVEIRLTGPMDALIKALAKSNVLSLETSKPEMDEIFLSFYGDDDDR